MKTIVINQDDFLLIKEASDWFEDNKYRETILNVKEDLERAFEKEKFKRTLKIDNEELEYKYLESNAILFMLKKHKEVNKEKSYEIDELCRKIYKKMHG